MPYLFGVCLAAFIGADYCYKRGVASEVSNSVSAIRQSSRLVYIWLYLLFIANGLAAVLDRQSFESASERLRGFLLAGIADLVLIRLFAIIDVSRITSPLMIMAGIRRDKRGRQALSGEVAPEIGIKPLGLAGLKG